MLIFETQEGGFAAPAWANFFGNDERDMPGIETRILQHFGKDWEANRGRATVGRVRITIERLD